jgi:phosphoribosylanthranilate isomerase
MSPRPTRIKVCCIASQEEAALAVACGANALGLVGPMPSGPGTIDDALAADIARTTPPGVESFLLTSRTEAADILAHVGAVRPSVVQIVQHVSPAVYPLLIKAAPETKRVQVIHVEDEDALALIPRYEPYVHAFLLDSGRPNAETVELGGTGRTHDWEISQRFVAQTLRPVFLAGGLKPDNVATAVNKVAPFGVDLCSGVRTDGALDEAKLRAFVDHVRTIGKSSPTSAPEP